MPRTYIKWLEAANKFYSVASTLSNDLESECAVVGVNWDIVADATASNGSYVTAMDDFESLDEAPADSAGIVYFTFTVAIPGTTAFLPAVKTWEAATTTTG